MKTMLALILTVAVLASLFASACGEAATPAGGLPTASPGPGTPSPAPNVGTSIGKTAPDFTLSLLQGGTVRLSDLRGKPVFINFWATWCGPCREEMPHIQAAYDEGKDKYHFLAVDYQESAATVASFFAQNQYTMPVPMDTSGKVKELYRVTGFPTTFLLDSNGVIRYVKVGPFTSKSDILRRLAVLE